jgi:aminobenzoyl-glutamate transport protein
MSQTEKDNRNLKKDEKKRSALMRFLDKVEVAGNKMPHPITLFFYLAVFVVILSFVGSTLGWSASGEIINRSTGGVEMQTITVKNLLNAQGMVYILTSMVGNFMGFAPLGIVLVVTFGIGLAEESGYIGTLVRKAVSKTSAFWITPVVVFLGIMSNVASVVGYVILIPLGGMIFLSYKKHPLAGMAAAFAGCSGGFSANLLIGPIDPLLSGISTEGAKILDPSYIVDPTGNWFFMAASTIAITIIGTYVTEKIIIPRLGTYDSSRSEISNEGENLLNDISDPEKKALKWANIVFVAMILTLIAVAFPQNSVLRNANTGSLVSGAPLMAGIIPIVMLMFFVPSLVYGRISKKFLSEKDIAKAMSKSMSTMGTYIALAFVASQFIAYFDQTNIGLIIALKGAGILQAANIYAPLLMVIFVLICAFLNLFMGSASAKWVILAPVFIPMLMRIGISPEMTQAAFRIGDSSTNIITPLMDYFPLILAFAKKYDTDTGMGTLISTMVPYSFGFLAFWILLMVLWMIIGLPLGPGVGVYL